MHASQGGGDLERFTGMRDRQAKVAERLAVDIGYDVISSGSTERHAPCLCALSHGGHTRIVVIENSQSACGKHFDQLPFLFRHRINRPERAFVLERHERDHADSGSEDIPARAQGSRGR